LQQCELVCSAANLLPFMYFPYVSWNTAVHVQILGEQMATPEGLLRLVSAEEAFARSAPARVPTAQCLDAHPEVPQLAANCELHVVLSESQAETFRLRRVLCEQSGQSQLFHYNELALLVHELSAHAGGPSPFEISHRIEWDTLVAGAYIYSPDDPESSHLFPLLRSADNVLFVRRHTLDSSKSSHLFEAVRRSKAMHAAAVTRCDEYTLELDALRLGSKKANLHWDHAWSECHEKCAEHDSLLTMRVKHLQQTQQAFEACEVTCTFEDMMVGVAPVRTLLAVPPTPQLPGERTLGVLKANPLTGDFMHKGRYHVEHVSAAGQTGAVSMDFVQAANSMLREGQLVYLSLDARMYADLRELLPQFCLDNRDAHEMLTETDGACQLEAYYVLGDSKATYRRFTLLP